MKRSRLLRLTLLALPVGGLVFDTMMSTAGCTRLKAVPSPSTTPTVAASASPDDGASTSTFPSPSPTPVPPTPTPQPTPVVTLLSPVTGQNFAASSIDITFTAVAPTGHKLAAVSVLYNDTPIAAFKGDQAQFKVSGWNPNVVNSVGDKADTTPVTAGDKSLTILAQDDANGIAKLTFPFHKPLLITGWAEMNPMPAPASHMAIFSDGAQPPSFNTLWGSVDAVETTVIPRNQSYDFNPAGQGAWSTLTLNGSSVPRAAYGYALHPSQQLVYVVGGRSAAQDLRTLDIYAPLRKTAEQSLAALTNARRDPAVVYHTDKFLYAIGGKAGNTPLYSVERVQIGDDGNPVGDWQQMADTQNARAGATAVQQGKQIWLFGGGFRPIEVYDPAANSWSFLTASDGTVVGTPEAFSNATMVPQGDRLFFFGGEREDGTPTNKIYEFSPGDKTWRTVGPMPTSAQIPAQELPASHMGGFFLGDSFYLVGGESLPQKMATKRVFKGTTL